MKTDEFNVDEVLKAYCDLDQGKVDRSQLIEAWEEAVYEEAQASR